MTNIQTVSYGVLGEADKIKIDIIFFTLGQLPQVQVFIMNDEKTFEEKFLTMPDSVYQNWGTDDQVVIDWVLDELELTEV